MLSRRQFAKIAGASLLATPAVAQSLEKVRVAMAKKTSVTPVFIAQQRGYFRDAGIELEPIILNTNQDAFLAVVANHADVAVGAMTIVALNIIAIGGLKIIAGQTREMQGTRQHATIVSDAAWEGGLRSLKDLKGRRIGIVPGTRYILGQIAAKYDFTLKEITIVPLRPNAVATAFKDNKLDAMIAGPPLPTGGHILVWAGDEVPWQSGAICTTPAMIRDHHEMLEHFLIAYTSGVTDYTAAFGQTDANGNLIKGPGADEFADLMASKFGVKRSDLASNWPRNDPDAWLDAREVESQIAFWRAEGRVDKNFDPESILDRSFGKID